MATSKTQKKFYAREELVLDGVLTDEAAVTGKSGSVLMEEHILSDIARTSVAKIVLDLVYKQGLFKALAAIFNLADTSLVLRREFVDLREFLTYTINVMFPENYSAPDEPAYGDIVSSLDSIYMVLSEIRKDRARYNPEQNYDLPAYEFDMHIRVIESLLKDLREDRHIYRPVTTINALLDTWVYLGECSYTYRLLTAMMSTGREESITPQQRLKLIELANKLPADWGQI